ncbi:protein with adenine-specific DNAmethyltransferase domains [groundwater metagenome]
MTYMPYSAPENLKTIEKVYLRLKNDREVQVQIEKIKSHPWVKAMEGER